MRTVPGSAAKRSCERAPRRRSMRAIRRRRGDAVAEALVDPALAGGQRGERLAAVVDVVVHRVQQPRHDPLPAVGHGDRHPRDAAGRQRSAARHRHLQLVRAGDPDDVAAVDGDAEARRGPSSTRPRSVLLRGQRVAEGPGVERATIAGQSSSVGGADLDHGASLVGRRGSRRRRVTCPGDGHGDVRRRDAHLRRARAPRRRPPRPGDRRRRVPRARRPVGLREVDDAADAGRARAGRRGHDPHRRSRRHASCRRRTATSRWCSSPTPCTRT